MKITPDSTDKIVIVAKGRALFRAVVVIQVVDEEGNEICDIDVGFNSSGAWVDFTPTAGVYVVPDPAK